MPHYSWNEQLNSFVNSTITSMSGLWTFVAGVGAVATPLIIHFFRKKQKNRHIGKQSPTKTAKMMNQH